MVSTPSYSCAFTKGELTRVCVYAFHKTLGNVHQRTLVYVYFTWLCVFHCGYFCLVSRCGAVSSAEVLESGGYLPSRGAVLQAQRGGQRDHTQPV